MRIFVLLTCALGALSAAIQIRDTATIQTDLNTVVKKVDNLKDSLDSFPETRGTLGQALRIHQDALGVNNAMKTATNRAKRTRSVTHEQAADAINTLEGLLPTIVNVLGSVEKKFPALQRLPVAGIPSIVMGDVVTLSNTVKAYEEPLISLSPDDLKPRAIALSDKINKAYSKSIAAIQKTCRDLKVNC